MITFLLLLQALRLQREVPGGKGDSETIPEAAKQSQSQLFPFTNAASLQGNLLTET